MLSITLGPGFIETYFLCNLAENIMGNNVFKTAYIQVL